MIYVVVEPVINNDYGEVHLVQRKIYVYSSDFIIIVNLVMSMIIIVFTKMELKNYLLIKVKDNNHSMVANFIIPI